MMSDMGPASSEQQSAPTTGEPPEDRETPQFANTQVPERVPAPVAESHSSLTETAAEHEAERSALHREIDANDWRQGSLLPQELYEHVRVQPFAPWSEVPRDAFCLVVMQDCDIVHDTLDDEPAAEILILEPIDRLNPARSKAAHPRELHLTVEGPDGARQDVRVRQAARAWIDRERLRTARPLVDWRVAEGHLDWIVAFLGNRYERTAFPDIFDKRAKALRRELKAIMKQFPSIQRFLIRVEPMHDLPVRDPYHIKLVAALAEESYELGAARYEQRCKDIQRKLHQAISRVQGIAAESILVGSFRHFIMYEIEDLVEFVL